MLLDFKLIGGVNYIHNANTMTKPGASERYVNRGGHGTSIIPSFHSFHTHSCMNTIAECAHSLQTRLYRSFKGTIMDCYTLHHLGFDATPCPPLNYPPPPWELGLAAGTIPLTGNKL